jgi:hypothetical protein
VNERSLVDNASSSKQVKKARRKEKRMEAQRLLDLREILSSAANRRFVWWLLGEAGVNQSVMRGGIPMALFYAGQQDFGHKLYARIIENEPDLYLLMQSEAVGEQKLEAAEAARNAKPEISDSDDGEDEDE